MLKSEAIFKSGAKKFRPTFLTIGNALKSQFWGDGGRNFVSPHYFLL